MKSRLKKDQTYMLRYNKLKEPSIKALKKKYGQRYTGKRCNIVNVKQLQ
jgi:hypothetical protein